MPIRKVSQLQLADFQNPDTSPKQQNKPEIKKEAVTGFAVRPATPEEQKIVQMIRNRAKQLGIDTRKQFAKIAVRQDGRFYLIQNPLKQSLWAELAKQGRTVVQVLSDKENSWIGVLVQKPDGQILFVSYQLQTISFDKQTSHRYGDWVVLSYWQKGQLIGINHIRMPEAKKQKEEQKA